LLPPLISFGNAYQALALSGIVANNVGVVYICAKIGQGMTNEKPCHVSKMDMLAIKSQGRTLKKRLDGIGFCPKYAALAKHLSSPARG